MQITKCLRTWIKYHEKRQKSLISSTRTFYDNDALHRTTCSDQKLAGWMPLFETIFFGSQGFHVCTRYCGKKLWAFVQSENENENEKKYNQRNVSVAWFCFDDVLFQRKCTLCGVNRFYVEMRIFLCSSFILCHSDFPLCMLLDWKKQNAEHFRKQILWSGCSLLAGWRLNFQHQTYLVNGDYIWTLRAEMIIRSARETLLFCILKLSFWRMQTKFRFLVGSFFPS